MENDDSELLAELYAAYCEFKNDATRSMLRVAETPETRSAIRHLNQAMPREKFFVLATQLQREPEKFSRLTALLQEGWTSPGSTRTR